jgi:hypothetical protein
MWSSVLCTESRLSILRTVACCDFTSLFFTLLVDQTHKSKLLPMLRAVCCFPILGSKAGPGVTARLWALHVSDIFVAQRLTMLLTMTCFLPSRAEVWSLVAPHCLTPFAFVVVMATLLTMPLAILWLATSRTVSWVPLASGDLAAFVLDIDVALGCVLLAVNAFSTRLAIVRLLATADVFAVLRHLSALITSHSEIPRLFTRPPQN